MTSVTYQFVTLLLLISCIVCPTESRNKEKDKERKYDKSTQYVHTSATSVQSVNLCSKNRDLKLVCHCSPDDTAGRARKAECWIFHNELLRHDSNWMTFHTQTNLEYLRFTVQSIGILNYVPSEAIRLLKQLKILSIEYGQMEEIQSFAFANLTQLQNVSLANNQIKYVHKYAFANHPMMEEIDMKENAIVDIDRDAFVNLSNLSKLNLLKNNLTILHDEVFQELRNLKELNLRSNFITVLTREVFKGLGNLRLLDLANNNLNFIGDTVFAELWSLQELHLNNNDIEKISERAFDGLNNLKILNLHNNRLKMLERGLFTGAPAVKTLNLADNSLETLTFNNMLPLMDNLVNHTSILTITDNKFVCDCRLSWMFDVHTRTKNDDLRKTLTRVKCFLENNHFKHPNHVDLFDNSINARRHGSGNGNDEDGSYYDDEVADVSGAVELFKLGIDGVPCPEDLVDPTELPLSHKSVGMDLSWLTQGSPATQMSISMLNLFVCGGLFMFQ